MAGLALGDDSEPRARKILRGLGFSKDQQDGPISALSGGLTTVLSTAWRSVLDSHML